MPVYQAIILGIVQGLTEFLPISSSAHLNLFPWVLGWGEMPTSFDVALHIGTLFAIVIFFFKDWIKLFIGGYKQVVKKEKTTEGKIFWYLVISTIPAGISRSGITMTVARALGIDRESAAKYSFLLATPITAAAVIFDLKDFVFTDLSLWLGILSSFVVGIIIIKFLLEYLKKGSFKVFAIYRVLIGIAVILLAVL